VHEDLRPPLPPFTTEAAENKVRSAENAWNTRDADWVSTFFTPETHWMVDGQAIVGRDAIMDVLTDKWSNELDFRLVHELWTHGLTRVSVRSLYEFRRPSGDWVRCHGNENWDFDRCGLLRACFGSATRTAIDADDRVLLWEAPRPRPADHPGLSDLGF
jgi:uncharacterized protein